MHHLSRFQQRKLEKAFARADREAALRKQDGACKYCLRPLSYKTVTRDHVEARSTGGLDHKDNIVAACAPCNRLKGSMDAKLFMRMITNPRSGEPIKFRLVWFDRRLNIALAEMERNVMRAVGRRK